MLGDQKHSDNIEEEVADVLSSVYEKLIEKNYCTDCIMMINARFLLQQLLHSMTGENATMKHLLEASDKIIKTFSNELAETVIDIWNDKEEEVQRNSMH